MQKALGGLTESVTNCRASIDAVRISHECTWLGEGNVGAIIYHCRPWFIFYPTSSFPVALGCAHESVEFKHIVLCSVQTYCFMFSSNILFYFEFHAYFFMLSSNILFYFEFKHIVLCWVQTYCFMFSSNILFYPRSSRLSSGWKSWGLLFSTSWKPAARF